MSRNSDRSRTRGIACIMASAVVFGFSPILTALSYAGGNNGVNMCLIRAVLPMPILFILAKRDIHYSKKMIIRCTALGAALYTCVLMLYSSYASLSVGVATTIHFLYPIFVALAEAFLHRKMPAARTLGALALAMVGCVFCTGASGGSAGLSGILLAAGSGIGYAAYILILERLPGGEMPVYKQMLGMSVVGAVISAAFGAICGRLTLNLTPSAWLFAACSAILVSVVGHGLFQTGERLSDGLDAALFSLLEPISSIIFSAVLIQERLTPGKVIGCIIILAALLAHKLGEKRSSVKEP